MPISTAHLTSLKDQPPLQTICKPIDPSCTVILSSDGTAATHPTDLTWTIQDKTIEYKGHILSQLTHLLQATYMDANGFRWKPVFATMVRVVAEEDIMDTVVLTCHVLDVLLNHGVRQVTLEPLLGGVVREVLEMMAYEYATRIRPGVIIKVKKEQEKTCIREDVCLR
ncbi:hypothetical protein BZG36_03957 [Bifiguratus adelaidae]|uniref:Uncharacterized protein n=1 Tax=Bifiguratus adelaidae TaxID=1938954 RepID=A0A261XZX4_9FUNG|nr:hypothetical protein BZG36_03957 [Bifiguratus adelaidae]